MVFGYFFFSMLMCSKWSTLHRFVCLTNAPSCARQQATNWNQFIFRFFFFVHLFVDLLLLVNLHLLLLMMLMKSILIQCIVNIITVYVYACRKNWLHLKLKPLSFTEHALIPLSQKSDFILNTISIISIRMMSMKSYATLFQYNLKECHRMVNWK